MKRAWLLGVALGLWLGWAPPAAAFCRTTVCQKCSLDPSTGCISGLPIAWRSSCVTYSLQQNGSTHVAKDPAWAAIGRAFAAWQQVECPNEHAPPAIRATTDFGEAACTRHEYNQTDGNANIVMFRDDDWPYSDATDALALTTVTYNANTGDIYDADMEINATTRLSVADHPAPLDFDLQSIVTHEAGHFFGLNHSLDPAATMTSQYSAGSVSFRDLAPDDIAGICAIYPPPATAACSEEPRQGFSPTCGISPTSGGSCTVSRLGLTGFGSGAVGAALAALGVYGVRRRRSRR